MRNFFIQTITKGGFLCPQHLLKIRYCVCPKFSPSFQSAGAHGGPDARADAFPNPSKSGRAHPHGGHPILPRFWKVSPKLMKTNDSGKECPPNPFCTGIGGQPDTRKAKNTPAHQGNSPCASVSMRFCLRCSSGQGYASPSATLRPLTSVRGSGLCALRRRLRGNFFPRP